MPIGKNEPLGKPEVNVTVAAEQLSTATGGAQLTIAPHAPGLFSTLIFKGHDAKTGGVLSITFTANVQEPVFPFASVALTVTFVVPKGKTAPAAGVCVMVSPPTPQLSVMVHMPI